MHMIRSVFRTLTGSPSSGSDENQSDNSVTSTPAQPRLSSNTSGSDAVDPQQTEHASLDSRSIAATERESLLVPAPDARQEPNAAERHQPETLPALIKDIASLRAASLPESQIADENLLIAQLDQRMLGHLCTDTPVDDCELALHMISRHCCFKEAPDMFQVSPQALNTAILQQRPELAGLLNKAIPLNLIFRLMPDPQMARELIRHQYYLFSRAPQELKTRVAVTQLLADLEGNKRHHLLRAVINESLDLALSLTSAREIIRICPHRLTDLLPLVPPQDQIGICEEAVQQRPASLEELKGILNDSDYQKLCDLALSSSGAALEYMDDSDRTAERVDKAVRDTNPPHPMAIPQPLFNEERLKLVIQNGSSSKFSMDEDKLSSAFFSQWNLWDTLIKKKEWLDYLPEHERTDALCCAYVAQDPTRAQCPSIPTSIRNLHPEWDKDFWEPGLYLPLANQQWAGSNRVHAARLSLLMNDESQKNHDAWQPRPKDKMQPWALLLDGAWHKLPGSYKKLIWNNGGTAGLADAFGAPPFSLLPQALLDPVQEQHCSRRAAWLPGQVALKLMFCDHFRPRNAALGIQLHQQMVSQAQALRQEIETRQLLTFIPTGNWELRGGRTLARTDEDGCLHMKLQRQGESLNSFAAESAAQDFARAHTTLGWHSEIPQSQGVQLVPLEALPVDQNRFPDALETYSYEGRQYALAFFFTTENDDYDTLAWQPDKQGGLEQARQGLLRACHDLGVWSSLGAVHTSTICLYHHFLEIESSRPELLLSEFFRPGELYPGTLHLWNTQATQTSDWGLSGLRDLGDQERYGFIHTYAASADAKFMVPDYCQRASFVNAIAQNIFGGLLHYMRLHRAADPDYHYQKTQAVADLSLFIEDSCEALLNGLLGDKNNVRLQDLFEQTQQGLGEVYPEWLRRTAEEIIYWSARQDHKDDDCFSQHLNKDGRPSAELYPGHPGQNTPYGEHFTEEKGENLGANNSKLPLFFLVRGLYVLAAGLADRLSASQQPDPMET